MAEESVFGKVIFWVYI